MTEMNRYLVQKDREIIENYIERKNLKMTESPTGLWYYVKDDGNGEYLKDNDRIVMDYECSLLDGTVCYSSADLGPKEIILGRSDLESGMNEGLRLLKPGAEALFILPPFLAFGLVGDGKKIPPRTIIVYSVSILTEK
jgi:FKBP-type peptidyl-prolyl cis-trans isomerase